MNNLNLQFNRTLLWIPFILVFFKSVYLVNITRNKLSVNRLLAPSLGKSNNHHSSSKLNLFSNPINSKPTFVSTRRQGKDIFDGWWGGHVHPDKDEDISKTFSYLMPILLLIAAVTLTIPIIALFFFIFMWKRPPSFLCSVLDPELKNGQFNAQPRLYKGLIDLLLTVDKAFAQGNNIYG
uniref:Uncharacterized protein n=1 Tax=Tetranychus urticae TaxID=32264 RepID=T1JUH0_TETUR